MNTGSGTIPVTILCGSLGAGKTTLLNHLLAESVDRRIAVLVNDMGDVNVDAELVAEGSELEVDDGVAELSNGCICCELQDDLETAVIRLAKDRSFDHLVVEASGISEPAPIARLFTTESRVAARYDVDGIVCVLDTPYFLEAFSGSSVERRGEEGDRPLSDLLVEQIESSNVVLLNKADRCTEAELARAAELVTGLQPDAETIPTEFSAVDPDRLLGIGVFERDHQAVRATAAAKALSWEHERAIDRAYLEYPVYGIIRKLRLTVRKKAAYRRALRTAKSLDGPPPRLRSDARCKSCEYRDRCGIKTRSLRSRLSL